MAPQHRTVDSQSVQQGEGFFGGALMKIHPLLVEDSRTAIAGPVGGHDPVRRGESVDLAVEGIDLVAPSAVKNN
jgi:hypothetical protein